MISEAEGFINQRVRPEYWRGVVRDYVARHNQALESLDKARIEGLALMDRYESLTGEKYMNQPRKKKRVGRFRSYA